MSPPIQPTMKPDAQALQQALRQFTDTHIVPAEPLLAQAQQNQAQQNQTQHEHTNKAQSTPLTPSTPLSNLATLRRAAQQQGLWGLFYPQAYGGQPLSLANYVGIAEEEGRSEYGPNIYGSRAALDMHMLHRHASPSVQAHCLRAMASGEMLGAYAMSEPNSIGSIPATLQTTAVQAGEHWVLNGEKWFISKALEADFFTVLATTGSPGGLLMLVVPRQTPGLTVGPAQSILGGHMGQGRVRFDAVRVANTQVLGQAQNTASLLQERLRLGRTLNAAQWVGLGQRCFELMCARVQSARGQLARLSSKQLVRQHVYQVHEALVHARALVQMAASTAQGSSPIPTDELAVNMAKLAASKALCLAADTAIQLYGAEGLGADTPLAGIARVARSTRILDGTDEVLINAIGKRLLQRYALA